MFGIANSVIRASVTSKSFVIASYRFISTSTPFFGRARTYESKSIPGSTDAVDPLAWAQRLFDLHEIRKNYTYSLDASPIFMICRLKPIKGTTFFERAFLEKFGIGSDVRMNNWKLIKNSPQNAVELDHIKHLIKIQPVTFPDGLPESEEDMINFRLLPNGKFVRRGNSPFRSDKSVNLSEWKVVEQPNICGGNLPSVLKRDENYRYLSRNYLRSWHNQRWQHHKLFSEFFTAKYKYRLNQDGLEYRYNGLWRLDDAMRQSLNHRLNADGTYRTNNNSRFEADWGTYPCNFSMHINEMPSDCLRKVFTFLSFHEVAQIRLVCRKFNIVAADLLKCEFCRLEQLVRDYRRELKLLLPRRESERRKHNMAGHADVLSAVETRISLLGMTIMRYVDEGYCSFFPGKVLDELRRVYVIIKSSTEPISRSTELLRELRDISSMAMEHFDEVLLPQIYESKLHRQQQSSNELAYQRRIRHLQSTSLLKNLSQSFPNLLDFGFGPPSSSSGSGPFSSASSQPSSSHDIIDPSVVNALFSNSENHPSQHDESYESLSSDDSLIATLTKQMSTMQQTIVALATSQRDMNDKITRLNNMVISLGYRIHRLETGSEIPAPERRKVASLKRTHEDGEVLSNNNEEEACGPSEPKRRPRAIDLVIKGGDQQALNLSSTSDQPSPLPSISHPPDPPTF